MNFLESHIQELKKAKAGTERAMAQVSDTELHWEPSPDANSIAILVKHIAGNMVSRWTDFLTTDGEKPNRERDGEFIDERRHARAIDECLGFRLGLPFRLDGAVDRGGHAKDGLYPSGSAFGSAGDRAADHALFVASGQIIYIAKRDSRR